MAKGTVKVDFAGTEAEIQKFVKINNSRFPQGLSRGKAGREYSPNGDFVLYASWSGVDELRSVQDAFIKLGWDKYEQIKKVHQLKGK